MKEGGGKVGRTREGKRREMKKCSTRYSAIISEQKSCATCVRSRRARTFFFPSGDSWPSYTMWTQTHKKKLRLESGPRSLRQCANIGTDALPHSRTRTQRKDKDLLRLRLLLTSLAWLRISWKLKETHTKSFIAYSHSC